MLQVKKKGLRDLGGTLRAEQAHHIAVGAETLALRLAAPATTRWRWRDGWRRSPPSAACYYPGLASHAQHERAARLFKRGFGLLMSFELRDGIDTLAFLDALQLVIVSSTWPTTARWRSPSRRRSTTRWARNDGPRWASPSG